MYYIHFISFHFAITFQICSRNIFFFLAQSLKSRTPPLGWTKRRNRKKKKLQWKVNAFKETIAFLWVLYNLFCRFSIRHFDLIFHFIFIYNLKLCCCSLFYLIFYSFSFEQLPRSFLFYSPLLTAFVIHVIWKEAKEKSRITIFNWVLAFCSEWKWEKKNIGNSMRFVNAGLTANKWIKLFIYVDGRDEVHVHVITSNNFPNSFYEMNGQ